MSFVSTVQAVTTRSGLRTNIISTQAATRTRFETEAIPVVFLPDCDLIGVETLSLLGPFATWRAHVEQLSLQVRRQITRLELNGSHDTVGIEEVNRDFPRLQYLNRCDDEAGIDLTVLQLFPSLRQVAFNWVRNFDVNQFTAMTWSQIRLFEFPYMCIGGNMNWLRNLNAANVETLDLSSNIISPRQIEAVAADLHRNCPRLQTINIRSEDAFDVGGYGTETLVLILLKSDGMRLYLSAMKNPTVLMGRIRKALSQTLLREYGAIMVLMCSISKKATTKAIAVVYHTEVLRKALRKVTAKTNN